MPSTLPSLTTRAVRRKTGAPRRRPFSASLLIGIGIIFTTVFTLRAQSPRPNTTTPQVIDYARDIKPIFEKNCYECHGPTKARGRLRLHAGAFILKGGASGPVVEAGHSDQSLLIHRVLGLDGDDQMPLDRDPLPDTAVALLKAWIDQGAQFPPADSAQAGAVETVQEHWAYVKPKRPELPSVKNLAWARNAIDRFVLAELEHQNLKPSAAAGKPALLRRVTLDLTGLPPTPAELEAFLADSSADAYERVVDRLLASSHFGERWARPWLDLARYADTNGYEKDNRRAIWKYRDWVIDAFNRDMPFNQFTIEQIAGDMLPNATPDQKIASGFHRNAMTNEEGGVDPDESLYEVLVDRANTTATVWLGTTLGCAQCHNHKYDPFSQKDYYRLLSFFANTDYEGTKFGDGTRFFESKLDLATPEQEKARKELQSEIDRLDKELTTATPALRGAQEQWESEIRAAEQTWTPLAPETASATNGVKLTRQPDGSVLASGPNPALTTYTITAVSPLRGITGVRLDALVDPSLPKTGPGRDAYGHFRITGLQVEIAPASQSSSALPAIALAPATSLSAGAQALRFKTMKVDDFAIPFKPEDLLVEGAAHTAKNGAWTITAIRDTTRVARHAVLVPDAPFGFAEGTRITVRIDHLDGTIGQGLGRFRLALTTAADPLVGADVPARLRPLLDVAAADRRKSDAADLTAFFLSSTPQLAPARQAITTARRQLVDLQIPSTLVMGEKASFERPSYELRERGSFTARGARVYAGTPKALHAMRDDQPANRLGLARWLIDDNNPLVARVAVNRLWELLFGRGIVETSEDFGTQGTPPSNQALLDWLATELMTNGWKQKAIIRSIVTSATYRQSSSVTPLLLERDPYNRLLARGPRFRLDAEGIRDVQLAVSGLLSTKMYGPSVFPSQPAGIWNMPYSSDKWTTSEGEDRYRRSIYTFWRRTSPYPSFMTFDATSREYCTARRVRTNTPLQALTLLNDPASFEAARALAARMIGEPGAGQTTRSRAAFGLKLVLSREALPAEVDRLVTLFEGERAHYQVSAAAAADVVGPVADGAATPDRAAWTIVANVLLNLDETLTKQ
jgi:mono/diheme cytochrome c family protein